MIMETKNLKLAYDTSVKIICKKAGFKGRPDGLSEIQMLLPTAYIRLQEAEKNLVDRSQKYYFYKKHMETCIELWRLAIGKIRAKRKKGMG